MKYAWKMGSLFDVTAQTAGEELERICKQEGSITPKKVVDESRPETAPLHGCFEWRDDVAAERYREQQARVMIAQITVVHETNDEKPVTVRAFVNTSENYQPISVVLNRPDLKEQMLNDALRELAAFRRKYDSLKDLKPVIEAIDTVTKTKRRRVSNGVVALE